MVPVGGDRAVFITRHNPENGAPKAWLGLFDATGEVAWFKELPGLTYSVYARHGITVSEGRVTIKVSDRETFAQVLAFDLETGEAQWQSPRIEFVDGYASPMAPVVAGERPYADGNELIHGDADGERDRLVARKAADGSRIWEREVDSSMRDLVFSADAVAYRADFAWTFLKRDSGEVVRTVKAYAAACSDEERFVTWANDHLITVDWSSPDFTVTKTPLPSEGTPLYCALRDGSPVFTVEHRWDEVVERDFELVAVNPDTASVDWRIGLGAWQPSSIGGSRDNDTPTAHPLRGTLTDFVPVLLRTHDNDGLKLAVLDLTKHEIAWEGAPQPELLQFDVFRGDASQYFLGDSGRVAALDGNTGKLTAAIKVGHERSRGFQAADGQLWLFSMEWARMNALPWMRLDGTTLEVIAAGNEEFRPEVITDEFADWLGAPQ